MQAVLHAFESEPVTTPADAVRREGVAATAQDEPDGEEAVAAGAADCGAECFCQDGLLPRERVTHGGVCDAPVMTEECKVPWSSRHRSRCCF